jgi:diacylglycerol kinase (ATP)
MRVLLLHNPTAGSGDADRRALIEMLRRHGYQPSYRSTKRIGWKRALHRHSGLIVIAGGDGTVAKVLRRLPADAPPVAILPSGSANNIALSLGINGDHEAWVRRWRQARAAAFVCPRVRVDGRERRLIEALGVGVFAAVIGAPDAESTNGEAKVAHGTGALLSQLQSCPSHRWQITLDGQPQQLDAIMLEVLNVPLIGPRLNLSPAMQPGGGWLDVVAVPASQREALIEWLRTPPGQRRPAPFVIGRARRIELMPNRSPLHLDDELWPKRLGKRSRVEVAVTGTPVRLLRPG